MANPVLDNNTVYLVDGSGYIFRAFFAIRSLRSKSGVPTNAVYGFTTMLLKLLKEHKPKYLAIAFDRKEPTFRHHIYPSYKANRPLPPADLAPQFDLIHRVVRAFNIKLLSQAGFEADDLIGTMAKRANDAGHEVVIVTGDKDLMQLVNDKTFLLDELRAVRSGGETFIDAKGVKEELGVWPHQVVDLLALAGDSSDNIPGVSGIGKKTAVELIEELGPLEKILSMTPLIKQKSRRERLLDGYDAAMLSKQLVTINDQVPMDETIADLSYSTINPEQTKSLFQELDFNRLLNDQIFSFDKSMSYGEVPPADTSIVNTSLYELITTEPAFNKLMHHLKACEKIAIITQNDANTLVGIAFAVADNQGYYVPLAHKTDEPQLPLELIKNSLNQLFKDPKKIFVSPDAKLAHKSLMHAGFSEFTIGGDPILASYLLHQDQERHTLKNLSEKYLGHSPTMLEELTGQKKQQIPFAQVPMVAAKDFCAQAADLTLRLENALLVELQRTSLAKLYAELELPLEEVLSRMEVWGVKINVAELKEAAAVLKARLLDLEKRAHELASVAFNLASPKQVAEILFETLKLPSQKKTKTGYSTDSSVLEKLISYHPLPALLLEHRMCAKLINTYIETLPLLIDEDHRLHTSYNQFVAATGRLSSSDPNLQNIPTRTKEGRKIREAFVAKEGFSLIALDYSQVELRILALVSNDAVLLDSFAKDQDVHRRTASEIFDVAPELVTKEQRDAAKTINFGLLYGMGVHRLAQTLNIPRKEAQSYLDKYFAKYAGVFNWKRDALEAARQTHEVRTLFGRKRTLPEISSKNPMEQSRAERIAINTPIQGTAADIIKKAMIDTDRYLAQHYPDAHLSMQVHDELVIEAKTEDAPVIAEQIAQIMAKLHGLPIELKVDFGIAKNWSGAH